MKSTFSVIYYLKRQVVKKDGTVPVMGRITVDGSRMVTDHAGQVELSLKPEVSDNFTPYYNNMYGTDEE